MTSINDKQYKNYLNFDIVKILQEDEVGSFRCVRTLGRQCILKYPIEHKTSPSEFHLEERLE
jgi:hypothetical protein